MKTIGSMRALDEQRGAIRVEDVYDTDIDDLWDACTDPERLARWIAEVSGDLRVGGTIHASFTSTWTGPGRIEACDSPHHLLLTMEPSTDDEAQIEVRDQGRGIPPDKLEQIFERFQQIDASDSRSMGGTGLGLAICRSIITQHGGRIWASSTPGESTIFHFTLPTRPSSNLR